MSLLLRRDSNIFKEIEKHKNDCRLLLRRLLAAKLASKDVATKRQIYIQNQQTTLLPIHYVILLCKGNIGFFDLIKFIVHLYPDCVKAKTSIEAYSEPIEDSLPIHLMLDKLTSAPFHRPGGDERLKAFMYLVKKYPAGLMVMNAGSKTPLIEAIYNNRNTYVKALLTAYPRLAKERDEKRFFSPIHHALSVQNDVAFGLILDVYPGSAKERESYGYGRLPIHYAIQWAKVRAIERLHSIYPEGIKTRDEDGDLMALESFANFLEGSSCNSGKDANKNGIFDKMVELLPEAFNSTYSSDCMVHHFLKLKSGRQKVAQWRLALILKIVNSSKSNTSDNTTLARLRKDLEAIIVDFEKSQKDLQAIKEEFETYKVKANGELITTQEELKSCKEQLLKERQRSNDNEKNKQRLINNFQEARKSEFAMLSNIFDNHDSPSSSLLSVEILEGMLQSLMQRIDNLNKEPSKKKRSIAHRFAMTLITNQNNSEYPASSSCVNKDDLIDTIKALNRELLQAEEEYATADEPLAVDEIIQNSSSKEGNQVIAEEVLSSTSATTDEDGGERSLKRARISLSPVQSQNST